MVLNHCEIVETECIFTLIDHGVISAEVCSMFMQHAFYYDYDKYVYLDWLLNRWDYLRTSRWQLPERLRIRNPLDYCIHCYSS